MRFAAVQFDIAWEDKTANQTIVEAMLQDATIAPGTFVLLPELGDTGFSMNLDRIVDDRSLPWAVGLAKRHGIFVQHGFARRDHSDGKGRNVAVVISPDGTVVADYEKVHPFSYGREADHYAGGDHLALARCGDAVVCPMICYDLRFPELWRLAIASPHPAEVFTIGASWPAARQQHWRSLLVARAIENLAYVVAVNRTGRDPHIQYAGGSLIVSPKGEILAEAGQEPTVLQAEFNLEGLRSWRTEFPALRDLHADHLGSIRVIAPTS
jgi:predicted amidohydrolase